MVGFGERLRRWFRAPPPVEPGLYPYRRVLEGREMRLHLRVDPDGSGMLSVNASGVIHLNETAVLLIKLILEGVERDVAVRRVRECYRVDAVQVKEDYGKVLDIIQQLETSEDACPLRTLNVDRIRPFGTPVAAPYRADLALTYDCNNDCRHCYVARSRGEVTPMDLREWESVLDRLWEIGVPHVCFTGGEATLSPHLVPLIEHAEDIGMITGLLTNGRQLSDASFSAQLCAAGLDHVQITLESALEATHDEMVGFPGAFQETIQGIRHALNEDIYLLTNTTLCKLNVGQIRETLELIQSLGVEQVAMNSLICTGKAPGSGLELTLEELETALMEVTTVSEDLGLRFIWYTPTRYCELNPMMYGIGYKRCTAAEYNICIEPDGQVLPCQSYYEPAGHILRDEWSSIWDGALFRRIRERLSVPSQCRDCPDFEVCGSGCPLSDGTSFLCTDSHSEG